MRRVKILIFSGSSRKNSLNKRLATIVHNLLENDNRVDASFINLRDYNLPIYDGDLEAKSGLPQKASELKRLFVESDGFIIASPEYNGSISPLLKNAIDWVSRAESSDEPPLIAFIGKVAAIMSASPSTLGGLRGLVALRMMLENIYVVVHPHQVTIRSADKAFARDGSLTKEDDLKRVKECVENFVDFVQKIKGE